MQSQDPSDNQTYETQLRMIWPKKKRDRLQILLPKGYVMRNFREEDAEAYLALMHEAGFTDFDGASLDKMINSLLPHGFYLIEYVSNQEIAATAMANHQPIDVYPGAGAVNWVAGAKKHAGRNLGMAVTSAAVNCLLSCCYDDIYLTTDDYRLPAIKSYLNIGFLPDFDPSELEMASRWQAVCAKLKWRCESGR